MHYHNALLDDPISKDYRIEHDFLLFILEILYTNTKSWRFDSIFRFGFRSTFWNRTELSVPTLGIESPRFGSISRTELDFPNRRGQSSNTVNILPLQRCLVTDRSVP